MKTKIIRNNITIAFLVIAACSAIAVGCTSKSTSTDDKAEPKPTTPTNKNLNVSGKLNVAKSNLKPKSRKKASPAKSRKLAQVSTAQNLTLYSVICSTATSPPITATG